jgi:hypothetical protein
VAGYGSLKKSRIALQILSKVEEAAVIAISGSIIIFSVAL